MERFCLSGFPEAELAVITDHLVECQPCHELFADTLRSQKGSAAISFTLEPEFWLKHEHVDFDQLVGFAESTLDATDQEIVDIHLNGCESCREDVRGFLAVRNEIEPELQVRYGPATHKPRHHEVQVLSWWRGLAWKPVYAAAAVLVGIAIVIGAAIMLKRRAENLQAKQGSSPQVSPGSTPDNRAVNVPSLPATPNESQIEKPNSADAVVVISDRGGTITVDKSGNVVGLDDAPASTRDEIAKVLMSERLEQPAILKELGGQEGSLRGSKSAPPFKLTYPSRAVIVTDRPTLKWQKAPGAIAYRVYVHDQAGHEVARSEELPRERTEWILAKPLKRGEIYAWTVVAVVDGKEIVSPGPSSPEMKFQVLSLSSLKQLSQLRRTRSNLALAGC